MNKRNVVDDKAFLFALRIIRLYKYLVSEKKEFVLSKQILRSGTSIGANVREGLSAQSRKEFVHKLNISLKEASETKYWLQLLVASQFLDGKLGSSLLNDVEQIIKLLTSIIMTTKENNR
ncbi:four helix bundle protein [Anaerobacillus sp. MEB173]|uniref:four helix bundle protein n=1 Tax=Anaerobacillus sp. MEB173 TaxID=3383345 RepID=UPI003F91A8B0